MKMMKRLFALLTAILMLAVLAGCQSNEPKADPTEVIAGIYKEFTEANVDQLPALMELDDEMLKGVYGVDPEWLDTYVCQMPMMNVHATEIFIAHVKDGQMDNVKNAIEARKAALDETWSMYLPAQYELVQKSETLTKDNYILFAVTEQMDSLKGIFEKATK